MSDFKFTDLALLSQPDRPASVELPAEIFDVDTLKQAMEQISRQPEFNSVNRHLSAQQRQNFGEGKCLAHFSACYFQTIHRSDPKQTSRQPNREFI